MNIPIDRDNVLLMVADSDPISTVVSNVAHPQNGNHVLAVDVRPSMKIRLSGANFISDTCTVSAEFRAWVAPVDRKLVPSSTRRRATGLDGLQLSVHGGNTQPPATAEVTDSSRDVIVFEWPAGTTTPGLYTHHLSFANTTDIPTAMIHDANCGTTPDFGPARSQVLHFIILPDLVEAAARVRLTEAKCEAKKSLIYDIVQTIFTGVTTRFEVHPSNGGLVGTIVDEISGEFTRLVFNVPADWDPALSAYPGAPPRILRFNHYTTAQLVAMDLPHGLSNIVVAIVLFALFLVAVLIVVKLLVALFLLLVVILPPLLPAAALGPVLAALAGSLLGFGGSLLKLLFDAMGNFYNIIVATFNAEPIGEVELTFSGAELAHLTSDFRFYEAIWTVPRSITTVASGGMERDCGASINTTRVRERWDSVEGGGDYRFTTEARPS